MLQDKRLSMASFWGTVSSEPQPLLLSCDADIPRVGFPELPRGPQSSLNTIWERKTQTLCPPH